mmetsp:Transcript_8278/g.22079  ORF Transcript_8278/g.22079 Transcript_8278/m.22079 type:complete len:392 (-) Transcript_8278:1380-2555(-)
MGLSRKCTLMPSSRPTKSGRMTSMARSKRPGRVNAASSTSLRLVAPITTMPCCSASKPSNSDSSWFTVVSRSSLPWPPPRRCLPTASSSSMKMMQGASLRAVLNTSLTRAAPRPMYISMNSEADDEMNATPLSPATALAMSVFPFPGGPTSSTPLGARAPLSLKRSGARKKSTTSSSSTLACSLPATSSKKMISSDTCTLDSRFCDRRACRTRRLTSMMRGSVALRMRAVLSLPISIMASMGFSWPSPSLAAFWASVRSLRSSSASSRSAAEEEPAAPLRSSPSASKLWHASYVWATSESGISSLLPSFLLILAAFLRTSSKDTLLATKAGSSSSKKATRTSFSCCCLRLCSSWLIMFIRSVKSPLTKRDSIYKPMMKALPKMGPIMGTYL